MTVDRYTRIDILVNNAGFQYIAPIPEFPEEKWNQLIGVMLTGPFLTTKYAFPHMMAQRKGRIINISSTQGLVSAEFKAGVRFGEAWRYWPDQGHRIWKARRTTLPPSPCVPASCARRWRKNRSPGKRNFMA